MKLPVPPVYLGLLLLALLPYAACSWMVEPFLLGVLFLGVMIWVALPIALGGIIAGLLQAWRRRSLVWPLRILGGVVCFGLLGLGTLYLNAKVFDFRVAEAKAYAEKVAPLLEAHRKTHGAYPGALRDLPAFPPLPRLLEESSYRTEGEGWILFFPAPGGLIDLWHYDSHTGVWVLT